MWKLQVFWFTFSSQTIPLSPYSFNHSYTNSLLFPNPWTSKPSSLLISSPNNDMFHSSRWKGMARSMSANPVWNAGSTLHLINAPQPPSTLFPPPPPTHTHTPKSILSGALVIYQYSLHLDVYSWSRGALLEYVKYPLPRLNRYHKSNIMEYILHSSVFFLSGLFTEKDRCI